MKMKYLLLLCCLLSSAFLADAQKNKKHKRHAKASIDKPINYMEIGAPLPPIKIYRRDGQYLTNETLKNDAHLIMMLFNPTCGHCEEVTMNIKDHIYLFKKSNLVLVAGAAMLPILPYFTNNTRVDGYPTIQIGVDSSEYIDKTYKQIALPQINIYDKDRKLVKIFTGDTPIDSLKQYID